MNSSHTSWFATAKRLAVAMVCLSLMGPTTSRAQDRRRYQPRLPLPAPCRPLLPAVPRPVSDGTGDILVTSMRGIWVIDRDSRVRDPIAAFDGVRFDPAADLSLAVENPTFRNVLSPYIGHPVTTRRLHQMAQQVIQFYRRNGHPVVDVSFPSGQDITDGIVQIVIQEGKVGQIRVHGGCRTDPCLVRRQSWMKPGQKIEPPHLSQELDWLNRNPFRDVDVSFAPGIAEGTTDLVYHIHDRRPIRGFIGYEDSGTRITGLERLKAGFLWTNSSDHLLSYQYSADAHLSGRLDVHSLEYRIPLFDSRDMLSIYGSWGRTNTAFDIGGVPTTRVGDAWQLSMRYLHDTFNGCCQDDELHFGFDVKGADNFAEFGIPSLAATPGSDVHVVQFNAGWSSEQRFHDGSSRYRIDFFGSPGGLLSNNHARDFKLVRGHTRATYAYVRAAVEETYRVGARSELLWRMTGQLSTSRLLPTEQLNLGGFDSIRGYDYRSINGDNGYVLNLEYRSLPIRQCLHGESTSLTMLAFADVGQHLDWGSNANLPYDDGDLLASVGVGMRYSVGSNVTVRFDYGLPLTDVAGIRRNTSGRIHLGAALAF